MSDHDNPVSVRSSEPSKADSSMAKKAAASAFLGGTVEYYDFAIFGTAAALVFGPLFFKPLGEAGGTLAAFGTFGVAYVFRPLGALLFSWLGDVVGRRNVILWILALMGISTFCVGVLPTYKQIGPAAPVLLVLLRCLQGLSAGAEVGGAGVLALEHAPDAKRGFYSSWNLAGVNIGTVLAVSIFIPMSHLSPGALLSWGWRIPFLLAAPLLLVAWYIRRSVSETEAFIEMKGAQATAKIPVALMVRRHWPSLLLAIAGTLMAVCPSILNVFALKYAVTHGIKTSTFLWCMIAAGIIGTLVQPLSGHVADKIGRRPVRMAGSVIAGLCLFPVFMAIDTGNIALILLALVGVWGGISMANGAGALFIEQFPTEVRFTGYAMGVTLAGVAAGFAPTIGASLMGEQQSNWVPMALLGSACSLIAAIGAYIAKETRGVQLRALGRRDDEVRLPPTTMPAERLEGDGISVEAIEGH